MNQLERIKELHRLFHAGAIPTLASHEVNPGHPKESRENYLYFTLPPCLNFQRSSPAMWKSALATWEDPETNYLFYPEQVVATPLEKVRADLLKHKLSLQPNKHTQIWTKISATLHERFADDPREVLKGGKMDAQKVLNLLQVTHKDHFPYLRGPKMANYWLYILTQYTDAKFANMGFISIIPDTHVAQCSVKLGLVDPSASPETIALAWRNLLSGSGIDPVDMHPVLWNWSRNDFRPKV
ncbi:MAG: hypothetical protein AAB865_00360 [Patescibacteria group bacterium]